VQRGKGIPESQPAMRHCMPPMVSIQINPISRRCKPKSGLQPRRCTPTRSRSIASSSASTAKTNTSTSARVFQPSPRLGRGTGRAEAEADQRGSKGWRETLVRCVGVELISPVISHTDSDARQSPWYRLSCRIAPSGGPGRLVTRLDMPPSSAVVPSSGHSSRAVGSGITHQNHVAPSAE
jgi:hypothetical protein